MTTSSSVLVWFRDDLRIEDHPALRAAADSGEPVVALYVLDDVSAGLRPIGGAARWWLHHSLAALGEALGRLGANLVLRRGPASEVVPALAREVGADLVVWSRRYEPGAVAVDDDVAGALRQHGVAVETFNGHLLVEPDEIVNKSGEPFKVFSPFWRAVQARGAMRRPLPAPKRLTPFGHAIPSDALDDWGLLPTKPNWAVGFGPEWRPGEAGARARLDAFLLEGLEGYGEGRNRPDLPSTSRLSPHLRFGEISPVAIWHTADVAAQARKGRAPLDDLEKFRSELGWREFSYHLLGQFPELASRSFSPAFADFPWRTDLSALEAWRRGRTGYPIVDAGMRQLWTTGWMHNRVRMICASFLVKHLLVDWREGEAWFWDTLVDADPANNAASWQWVAGTGADAAPYVRVFNPVLQGAKFDPDGLYVRRWVPELARLPNEVLHAPWTVGGLALSEAAVRLGRDYPEPIIDHAAARERALGVYQRFRGAA